MKKFALAAIPALLMAFQPAEAKISGSATLKVLSITLSDTDPYDMVGPSVTYTGSQGVRVCAVTNCTQRYNALATPEDLNTKYGAALSGATVEGDGSLIGARISVGGDSNYGDYFNASVDMMGRLILSPGTGVLVTALASAEINGSGNVEFAYDDEEYGGVGAGLYFADYSGMVSAEGSFGFGQYENSWDPFSYKEDGLISAYYENKTDGEIGVDLYVFASVDGLSGVPLPVPEPSAYALMLAGLGAVVGAARARRRFS